MGRTQHFAHVQVADEPRLRSVLGMLLSIEGECWVWNGPHNPEGYGLIHVNGRRYGAHRASYELHRGRIPDGLYLDHLCRNPSCIRPEHLEPVTNAENQRRGRGANNRPTHCHAGHPFDEANTYVYPTTGRRLCRPCHAARARRYLRERKAVA